MPGFTFAEHSISASIQEVIRLSQAGVQLTPQQAAAVAAYLATTETTTILTTDTTTTIETTTTTTVTTTTTTVTTTTPYPCVSCTPIYSSTCQGLNMPSPSMYCLTAAEVPVSYTLGGCSTCGIPLDSCQTTLACPSGTAARLDGGSGDINGNSDGSPTFLYCSEAAGLWYGRIDGSDTPIISAACKYP
ncbi:unnamed protein product [Caenorhabditis nigoni]